MKLSGLSTLSKREIEKIDWLSRILLQNKGILLPSDKVKDFLVKKGVNFDGYIARFTPHQIESSLESVPKIIKIFNRDNDYSINIGENVKFASGHNAVYILNKKTRKRVPIKKEEVANFALISDYFNEFDLVGIEAYPQDVNPKSSILHGLDAVLNNTSKPVYFSPETYEETKYLLKIIELFTDDIKRQPTGICQVSPHSPLSWDKTTIEALAYLASVGFPTVVLPAPFSFVSAPITLAGEILLANVELLGSLVVTQLINPGAPFIFGNAKSVADPATGSYLIATPECNLFRIASADIAKFYGIPSHSIGPDTDSNIHDEQNGYEKMFSLLSEVTAGINIIINAGMFATGMTVSLEQLMVDTEMIRFIKRYMCGIEATDEKLAFDSIMSVDYGKDFITDPLTLRYLRGEEHKLNLIANRKPYELWRKDGCSDIIENAENKAKEIINNYTPKPLDHMAKRNITTIINEFEQKYGG